MECVQSKELVRFLNETKLAQTGSFLSAFLKKHLLPLLILLLQFFCEQNGSCILTTEPSIVVITITTKLV